MKLTIDRFDNDETGILEGPIVQVTNDEVALTFSENEYKSLTAYELVQMVRSERASLNLVFAHPAASVPA